MGITVVYAVRCVPHIHSILSWHY